VEKDAILKEIVDLIDLQENAIQQHPPEVAAVYTYGRGRAIEGQRDAVESEADNPLPITLDEFKLVQRYMLTSSFISAFYHLAGDKARRDQAAHSCSLLVSGLGLDSELVLRRYIDNERNMETRNEAGGYCATPIRLSGCAHSFRDHFSCIANGCHQWILMLRRTASRKAPARPPLSLHTAFKNPYLSDQFARRTSCIAR
jgi:hypothetical protein